MKDENFEPKNKFFCKYHGEKIISVIWQNSFVLECGCAYHFNERYGIEYINSTATQSVDTQNDNH